MSDYVSVARIFDRHAEAFAATDDFSTFCDAIGEQGSGIRYIGWAERQFHTMRLRKASGVRAPVAMPFASGLVDVFASARFITHKEARRENLLHLMDRDQLFSPMSGRVKVGLNGYVDLSEMSIFVEPNAACLEALRPLIGTPASFRASRLETAYILLTANAAGELTSTWVAILSPGETSEGLLAANEFDLLRGHSSPAAA